MSNIPLPAKLAAQKHIEEQQKPKQSDGWWSIEDVAGSLEGVIRAIDAKQEIPAHWREAIKADARARCVGGLNFVYVDAHFFVEKGSATMHYTVSAESKLL